MLGFSFWYHMLEELHFQWQMGHLFSETPQGGVHNISAGNHLEMKCLKFYFISMKRTQQSNASASVHFDPLCTSLRNVERTNEQAILFVFPCLGITNFVILFNKQQQQHSLFSQASWSRLEMKPERNKFKVQAH